jgi:CheY-like chemotaxis protein
MRQLFIMTNLQAMRSPLPPFHDALHPPRRRERLDGLRVLVAAEDAWVRWTLCGWLSCLGATLRQVGSGADALEALAETSHFDLVIAHLHVKMPDGIWLVATMRAVGLATPCILVDGRGRADLRARCRRLGPTIAVAVPPTLDALAFHAQRALTLQ